MMMETRKVTITVYNKPKGLIAVPFWVYIRIIGMEFEAVETKKPWNLVMGKGTATHHIDCWEVKKEELLKKMEEKKFYKEADWFKKYSIYKSKESLLFNIGSCELIH